MRKHSQLSNEGKDRNGTVVGYANVANNDCQSLERSIDFLFFIQAKNHLRNTLSFISSISLFMYSTWMDQ